MHMNLGTQSARASQRNDVLHMPVINLNQTTRKSSLSNDNRQTGTNKSGMVDSSMHSSQYPQNSDNDDPRENEYRSQQNRKYPRSGPNDGNTSSTSEVDHGNGDDDEGDEENDNGDDQSGVLNENARRLLVLGTIRPSRTFYKNLPEADVNHLMDYFRRMKQTHHRVTSDEINQELATKYVEYKPKMCKSEFDRFLLLLDFMLIRFSL